MKFEDGSQNLRLRLSAINAVVVLLLAVLGIRLYVLQIVRGKYYADLAENQRIRLLPIPAPRGVILDRNGQVLVDSRPIYHVVFSREDVKKLERILALVRAKRLEELERSRVKNVLKELRALDGVAKVAEAVFGRKLSVDRTWKLIWGTLIFVGIFTTIHFLTWLQRSREARRKETAEKIQSA